MLVTTSTRASDCEMMLATKAKHSVELDPLRNEVRQLEESLFRKLCLSKKSVSGTKTTNRNNNVSANTVSNHQLQDTRQKNVESNDGDEEGKATQAETTSESQTQEDSNTETPLLPKKISIAALQSRSRKMSESARVAEDRRRMNQALLLARQSFVGDNSAVMISVGNNSPGKRSPQRVQRRALARSTEQDRSSYFDDRQFESTPMLTDSVFRDGMLSVLIGDGWSPDQALAALVATKRQGTLAAAKSWLKEVLVSATPVFTTSPSRAGSTQNSPRERSALSSVLVGERRGDNFVVNNLNTAVSAFSVPPSPPARRSKTLQLPQITQNPSSFSSITAKDEFYSSSSSSVTLPNIHNNSSAKLEVSVTERKCSAGTIRIKIRRPSDGQVIQLRRAFVPSDLLSTVLMAFVTEQGEDASTSTSSQESERAASFARMVSASSSRWCLMSTTPPKRAFTWNEMDRTLLEDVLPSNGTELSSSSSAVSVLPTANRSAFVVFHCEQISMVPSSARAQARAARILKQKDQQLSFVTRDC